MVEYFVESFSDFSSLLDEIYYDHIYFYSRAFGECCTHSDERITEFIQNMNQYREQKVKILEQ